MEKDDEDGSETGTGIYVTEVGPDDVLLGRGTGPSSNEGNVTFRSAVEAMKSAYVSTPSRKAKNKLVRKTVDTIKAKNGRFLSKVRKSEAKMLGLSTQKQVYEVVNDAVAFEKTKQAIRYVHYKKDGGNGSKRSIDELETDSGNDTDGKHEMPSVSSSKKKARKINPMGQQDEQSTKKSSSGNRANSHGETSHDDSNAATDQGMSLVDSIARGTISLSPVPQPNTTGPVGHQLAQSVFAAGQPTGTLSPWTTSRAASSPSAQSLSATLSPGSAGGGFPMLGLPSSGNLYSMLLSQSLPAGARTLPPRYGTAPASALLPATPSTGGLASGLFQQALQNEQLRAILLSDERYRNVFESLLLNGNRNDANGS